MLREGRSRRAAAALRILHRTGVIPRDIRSRRNRNARRSRVARHERKARSKCNRAGDLNLGHRIVLRNSGRDSSGAPRFFSNGVRLQCGRASHTSTGRLQLIAWLDQQYGQGMRVTNSRL